MRTLTFSSFFSAMSGSFLVNYRATKHIAASANWLNIQRLGVIAVVINRCRFSAINAIKLGRSLYFSVANCSCNSRMCALLSNYRSLSKFSTFSAAHWLSASAGRKVTYFRIAINAKWNPVNYFPFEFSNALCNHLCNFRFWAGFPVDRGSAAQVSPIDIRAKTFAANDSVCCSFNSRAVFSRDASFVFPLPNCAFGDANDSC